MFWTRLASGIVLVVIALCTMSLGGIPLLAVTLLISMIAYKELTAALLCATEGKKLNLLEALGLMGVLGYYAAIFFSDAQIWLFLCIIFMFMALMFVFYFNPKTRDIVECIDLPFKELKEMLYIYSSNDSL